MLKNSLRLEENDWQTTDDYRSEHLKTYLAKDRISGFNDDKWKQVIQRLTDEMEFAVTYSIPDNSFSQELWVSQVPGSVGLLQPQTLPGGYLRLNPRFNSPGTIAKRCKAVGRPQRDCILEWAKLNPEKISQFLD